jgi:hypothetical protein
MRYVVVAWVVAVAGGFGVWGAAEAPPGRAGPPAAGSPRAGPSVVVYVHPHCPCTRAALPAILDALAVAPPGTDCRVVFALPVGVPDGWERTRSWDLAAGRPGVAVEIDRGGTRAAADGAETSGHAVARDAAGRVAFRGGLSRPGTRPADGAGLRAVAAVLAGCAPDTSETPVFGCPLTTPAN